jgi:hypothetical protein
MKFAVVLLLANICVSYSGPQKSIPLSDTVFLSWSSYPMRAPPLCGGAAFCQRCAGNAINSLFGTSTIYHNDTAYGGNVNVEVVITCYEGANGFDEYATVVAAGLSLNVSDSSVISVAEYMNSCRCHVPEGP